MSYCNDILLHNEEYKRNRFWVEPLKSVSQTQTETATVKTTQIEVSFIEKILYIHSLGKCNVILRYLFDIYV